MSIFDDDFYSTKVSRKAVRQSRREDRGFPLRSGDRRWSSLQIAFASSLISALAVVLLFGIAAGGFGSGDGSGSDEDARSALAGDPSQRTIAATAKVRPSVVSVINEQTFAAGIGGGALEDDSAGGIMREAGVGSGFIIQKSAGMAFVVTNYHVVADAEQVEVVLSNGELRKAAVVGLDQITDLAVLQIDAKGIDTVAELGDSSALQAAEFVMAIGNPLGMGESITMGIVSVTHEIVPVSLNQNGIMDWEQEVIRVDAAINQGNSGGPLIDLNGEVVGINSMKIADIGVESIGYAIPINNAIPIIEELIAKGYVARPYLGVYTLDLAQYWDQLDQQQAYDEEHGGDSGQPGDDGTTSGQESRDGETGGSSEGTGEDEGDISSELDVPDEVFSGVIVLEADGPALEAGLQFNDVIVKLDKQGIGSTKELRKYLYDKKKIGDELDVTFYRDGEQQTVTLKLGEKAQEKDE